MTDIATQAVRDIALREIANLPLTDDEWFCLAGLAMLLTAAGGGGLNAIRLIFAGAFGGDE